MEVVSTRPALAACRLHSYHFTTCNHVWRLGEIRSTKWLAVGAFAHHLLVLLGVCSLKLVGTQRRLMLPKRWARYRTTTIWRVDIQIALGRLAQVVELLARNLLLFMHWLHCAIAVVPDYSAWAWFLIHLHHAIALCCYLLRGAGSDINRLVSTVLHLLSAIHCVHLLHLWLDLSLSLRFIHTLTH